MGTVIILLALGVIVALVIRSMIRNKKNHTSTACNGDCGRCRGCHSKQ